MSLTEFINENISKNPTDLIFFGGSFDPWHLGHTECIKLAPNNCPIIIIPDNNPFKSLHTEENRGTSVKEITDNIKDLNKDVYIFEDFLSLKTPTPTWNWVNRIKSDFPDTHISLLVGNDSFISIDKWNNSFQLLSDLTKLLVVSREDDEAANQKQLKILNSINDGLEIQFLGHHIYEHLSSTKMR